LKRAFQCWLKVVLWNFFAGFFGITMRESLFFVVSLDLSLKHGVFQRTMAFHIGFVLL
jgi:hypothetical protein